MKKEIIGLCMFIFFSGSMAASSLDRNSTRPEIKKDSTLEKEAVMQTLVAMWDAIEKGDVDRYATYVHPNFTQFGETDPSLKIGKTIEVASVKNWVANSKDIHTEMIDPRVQLRGKTAWITYYWSDKGTTNGKSFTSKGKSTRIFVKEEGKWLCIHGHYTLLP